MRLGSFIITHNRPLILKKTVESYLRQTRRPDVILIVDNGSSEETEAVAREFEGLNVIYHDMGENTGPAGASAYALKRLSGEGYDWILWGDDDDPPLTDYAVERLVRLIENNDSPVLGGVGSVGAIFDWKRGKTKRISDDLLKGVLNVDLIGGNHQFMVKNEAVKKTGFPAKELFFGSYEPEYSLRMRNAGFLLLVDGGLMRDYREKSGRLGLKPNKYVRLPGLPYQHIWRRYYRTRNYIYMMKNTFSRPDLAARETLRALARSLLSWFRGFRYGAAFTAAEFGGIKDGYKGRLGRTILPTSYSFKRDKAG